MSAFAAIHKEAFRKKLRFLVIGGLAINYYGYSRETADLDLLISLNNRTEWMALLSKLDYRLYHDGGNFIQFETSDHSAWPVDLMVAQEKTFGQMYEAGREANLYGVKTRVPSLEHLLALKLHALKNTRVNRFLKDFLDVENLIKINRLDVKSPSVRALFDKYGTAELYEKLSRSLAGS